MQNTKQVLDGDKKDIFKRKREFYLNEDLVDKLDSIEYGAQVNKIEEIEVNGVPVEPDESKTVKLKIPRVINAVTSDSESDALSAAMGKYLYTLITESHGETYTAGYNIEISDDNVISTLRQPDHYLGHWNCIKGQSPDFLETAPYNYNAGDYYIVNKTADMSWTNRTEMLGGEYHIPSLDEIEKFVGNETAAEVIYNITNYHVGLCEIGIHVPTNPGDVDLNLNLWASNGCYGARESDGSYGFDAETANEMPSITNGSLYQVLAFKDEPVVPDNTWTSLGDDVYYKSSLGLYSVLVGEDEWITFKDKVEGATTSGGKGNLYQRGNCNPINVNEYEINTDEIDYSQIQPSTYYSNKIAGDSDLFVNADDAWGAETQTASAMRGPCPEGYIVPPPGDIADMYMIITYLINGGSAADIQGDTYNKIMALENLFLTQSVNNHSIVGSILPTKFESVEPTGEGWNIIQGDNLPPIYHNESLGLISVELATDTYATFKDKLLGATEMFDPIGEYLQKGSVTLNKAKLGNQYNWGNNYVFDLFGNESIEYIIDSDADIVSELQSKTPYGYNGSIVFFASSGSSGGGGSEMMYASTKAAPGFGASIFSANPNLWDYTEVQHNLRPLGTEYVEDPSTDSEIENERVDINDIYLYDGTQWLLIGNHVVPHVFVTQKEYDAISNKKYSNGTLYLFVDKHPGDEGECDGMYEYNYFYNLWDNWGGGGRKVSSILPSDYSYCKDYIVAELNSKPMCYYNKFREENKLVAGSIPKPSPKSGNTKLGSDTAVRFLGTEESSSQEKRLKAISGGAYLDYVETHDDACGCDECTYHFYTIDGSQWFEYNSYCGGTQYDQ